MQEHRNVILDNVIQQPDGCWIWQGPFNQAEDSPRKYGKLRKKIEGCLEDYAHRFSFLVFKGPITIGLYVCHTCDVRTCVNPDHLFLGSQKENLRDMINKGRFKARTPKSEKKLSEAQALLIRKDNRLHRVIAEEYGITRHEVRGIKNGRLFPQLSGTEVIKANYGVGLKKPRKIPHV